MFETDEKLFLLAEGGYLLTVLVVSKPSINLKYFSTE